MRLASLHIIHNLDGLSQSIQLAARLTRRRMAPQRPNWAGGCVSPPEDSVQHVCPAVDGE